MANQGRQFDRIELAKMLKSGKSPIECAKHFGVTSSAICQARKEINVGVIKNVVMENAANIVTKNLNAVDQLQQINTQTHDLLELLTRWANGDKEALKLLEQQTGNENIRFNDPKELMLKCIAEIRSQLKLQLEIFQTLYDMDAVQKFQTEVLTAIGEVDKETRKKIIERLNEKSALRKSISFDK